jgi:hypothetical protein
VVVPIEVTWEGPRQLHVTAEGRVDWRLTLASSPKIRVINAMGAGMPLAAWRSTAMLKAMGAMASATLGVGKVSMTGLTANGLPFDANPLRIWRVVHATATINGDDAGLAAPLAEQARLGDFWVPQQGIFAMGRVFLGAAS